jgi:HEXXH motif-containing protein
MRQELISGSNEATFERILELPLILMPYLGELDLDFEVAAVLPVRLASPSCAQTLISETPRRVTLRHSGGVTQVTQCDAVLFSQTSKCLATHDPSVRTTPRQFVAEGAIEIAESVDFPFSFFDDKTATPWVYGNQTVVNSICHSLDILVEVWPEAFDHLKAYAKAVIPYIPNEIGRHNSSTSNRYFFTHALDVSIGQELHNLGSMIHESLHCKLRILMACKVLYHNAPDDFSFRHPWMAVPRPLRGVFMGAHAFVNVLSLCCRARDQVPQLKESADAYIRTLGPQVEEALVELEKGDLTEEGERFRVAMVTHYRDLAI